MKMNGTKTGWCLLAALFAAGPCALAQVQAGPVAKMLLGAPWLSPGSEGDPVAVMAVNGAGIQLLLDGSLSSDPNGDPLSSFWAIDGVAAGSGPRIRAHLDVGPHEVMLVVSDDGRVASDRMGVEVITGGEAVEALMACLSASGLSADKRKPLAQTLQDAWKEYLKGSDDHAKGLSQGRPDEAVGKLNDRLRRAVEKLKEFQEKVRKETEKGRLSRAMAEKLIGLAQEIIRSSQPLQAPGQVQHCESAGKPNILVFTYNGQGCEQSMNAQMSSGKSMCSGSPRGAPEVGIAVKGKNDPLAPSFFVGRVQLGQMLEVQAAAAGADHFEPKTYFFIYTPDGRTLLQTVRIDTSCATPLRRGDTFGSLELVDYLYQAPMKVQSLELVDHLVR